MSEYKTVPVEPTVHQEAAGRDAAYRSSTLGEACAIYKAMLEAAPQAPEWVGLTQEDKDYAFNQMPVFEDYDSYAEAIEQRLREKNRGVK